jgi:ParB family transcriptional regulator, chromosome partitioning protein
MKASDLTAKAIGVQELLTDSLKPNPHNPRMLFDRRDMEILHDSIGRVGILVPLTVYREGHSGDYVILDGQRRWICAQELKIKRVPVNEVAEPSLVQNIVTMFQIHKLRKDWELMPTALKLELLMRELKEKHPRRLSQLTGLEEAVVVRCKKLLSFPKKYQDMMLAADPERRTKADFFIELYAVSNDRAVKRFPWFKKNRFTDAMLRKSEAKGLKAVTDFRVVKQHINNAVKSGNRAAISKRLREFADDPTLTPDFLNIESAAVAATAKKLSASVDKLFDQLRSLNVESYYGEEKMWDRLSALARLIRSKLKELGRRLEE